MKNERVKNNKKRGRIIIIIIIVIKSKPNYFTHIERKEKEKRKEKSITTTFIFIFYFYFLNDFRQLTDNFLKRGSFEGVFRQASFHNSPIPIIAPSQYLFN